MVENKIAPSTSNEKESFAALLEESLGSSRLVGTVLKGTIINIENDMTIIDVGLKSEGRVPLKEFSKGGQIPELKKGDRVDVYVESMEGHHGEIILSHDKARREAAWIELEKAYQANEHVSGIMFGRVRGGFTVDLSGAIAFLPGSQVDIRPIKDVDALMGIEQPFAILKMDRLRGNIVVSRRAILEESQAEAREGLMENLEEGKTVEGIVKNITDYGAFIDLGGIDGLLHVTDLSWQRVNHPSEILQLGQTIKVQVIRFNKDSQRISLGLKQLSEDPWVGVENRYKVDDRIKGKVTNITDYGAFVELESGVEGLIHVSEMSWTKKNIHPNKVVSLGDEVEVMVLEIESEKRRIALGLKHCQENPWATLKERYPVGNEVTGEVRNITEFGMFVNLEGDIDGMVHMSDLSWEDSGDEAIKTYNKGDKIKVKILEIDPEKERVAMGVKQLTADPFTKGTKDLKKGTVVTCEVTEVKDDGIAVKIGDEDLQGFIKRAELSAERSERRPDRFAVGEKVDARISQIDRSTRKLTLSIKALEVQEEKKAMELYGSADSGASLGDILGAALEKKKTTTDTSEEASSKTTPKSKAKATKAKSEDETEENKTKKSSKTASKAEKDADSVEEKTTSSKKAPSKEEGQAEEKAPSKAKKTAKAEEKDKKVDTKEAKSEKKPAKAKASKKKEDEA